MIFVDCYCCKEVQVSEDDPHFPFHLAAEKEQWANKNYGKKKDGKRVVTIEEMQTKLKEWGKKNP